MSRLNMFNSVSLDGYFTDSNNDISWAHAGSSEDADDFQEFVAGNAKGASALVFGRVTYEMMASFWPTPAAAQQMPEVAAGMNRAKKVVFSRNLKKADWANTTVLNGDPVPEIAKLKRGNGSGLTILGSGSIVKQLAAAGLIDDYQLMVCPVILGSGRTLFDGIPGRPVLKLANSRAFKNGKVFLHYTV
ncbi:MAG TPA: dihydrofolate reductase family protein [Rhizomicrobium sp.]|nr:dihydrofolate reductase family protein [Rhizomicrobium sp.]